MYQARNGNIRLGNTEMDYIRFGRGGRTMVMLPGVGDERKTVKGHALPMALAYRTLADNFTVYAFSRKNRLPDGYTTRQMANDLAVAIDTLDIHRAHIVGISQGGMIAQWLAIDYPQHVERLVLTVSVAKCNATLHVVMNSWIAMAQSGNYEGIIVDSNEKSYSEHYLAKRRPFLSFLARMSKPKDFQRFIVQATSCLKHNSEHALHKIQYPTLVIGGGGDLIVGGTSSHKLADHIRADRRNTERARLVFSPSAASLSARRSPATPSPRLLAPSENTTPLPLTISGPCSKSSTLHMYDGLVTRYIKRQRIFFRVW